MKLRERDRVFFHQRSPFSFPLLRKRRIPHSGSVHRQDFVGPLAVFSNFTRKTRGRCSPLVKTSRLHFFVAPSHIPTSGKSGMPFFSRFTCFTPKGVKLFITPRPSTTQLELEGYPRLRRWSLSGRGFCHLTPPSPHVQTTRVSCRRRAEVSFFNRLIFMDPYPPFRASTSLGKAFLRFLGNFLSPKPYLRFEDVTERYSFCSCTLPTTAKVFFPPRSWTLRAAGLQIPPRGHLFLHEGSLVLRPLSEREFPVVASGSMAPPLGGRALLFKWNRIVLFPVGEEQPLLPRSCSSQRLSLAPHLWQPLSGLFADRRAFNRAEKSSPRAPREVVFPPEV